MEEKDSILDWESPYCVRDGMGERESPVAFLLYFTASAGGFLFRPKTSTVPSTIIISLACEVFFLFPVGSISLWVSYLFSFFSFPFSSTRFAPLFLFFRIFFSYFVLQLCRIVTKKRKGTHDTTDSRECYCVKRMDVIDVYLDSNVCLFRLVWYSLVQSVVWKL